MKKRKAAMNTAPEPQIEDFADILLTASAVHGVVSDLVRRANMEFALHPRKYKEYIAMRVSVATPQIGSCICDTLGAFPKTFKYAQCHENPRMFGCVVRVCVARKGVAFLDAIVKDNSHA